MLTRKKWTYVGLVTLLSIGLALGIYQVVKHKEEAKQSTYGYVNLQELMIMNPKYAAYNAKKLAYENMQAQYEAEQKMMALKEANMERSLASIHSNPGLAMATQAEFRANLAVKEAEANTKLTQAYDYYVRQFSDKIYESPTAADLRIVNLQLQLLGLQLSPAEKEAKEKELATLLDGRTPTLLANDKIMMEDVMKMMAPLEAQVHAELNSYANQLGAGLQQMMAHKLAFQEQAIVGAANLPNPFAWQVEWHERLGKESNEVNALHDEIVADIRVHIATVAEKKGLTLVVDNPEVVTNAYDITNDVIASFKN